MLIGMKKDRPSIESYLEFLNKFSTEPNLSWAVPHLYESGIQFDICWMYDKTTTLNWYFKAKSTAVWSVSDIDGLMRFLTAERANLSEFELEILKVICVQAVCAHFYVEKAGDLIGKDRIDSTIELLREVMDQKEKTATSIKSDSASKKIPRLKLIDKKKKKDQDE